MSEEGLLELKKIYIFVTLYKVNVSWNKINIQKPKHIIINYYYKLWSVRSVRFLKYFLQEVCYAQMQYLFDQKHSKMCICEIL